MSNETVTYSLNDNDIYSNAEIINKDSFARLKYKSRQRDLRRKNFYVLTALFICAVFLLACVLLFFKVQSIAIEGSSIYDESTILDCCGINLGTNLYLVKESDVNEALCSKLPYIKSVKIKRTIPSTITLIIEEDTPFYYTELLGQYFVLSNELRVIAAVDSEMAAIGYGSDLIKISLPDISSLIVGRNVEFLKTSDYEYITEFLFELCKENTFNKLNCIDISNKYHISVIVNDGKYKILLGNSTDIVLKLNFVRTIIENGSLKESLKDKKYAQINVEYGDSIIVSASNDPFEY